MHWTVSILFPPSLDKMQFRYFIIMTINPDRSDITEAVIKTSDEQMTVQTDVPK